ncbi:tetratricopeptide repeat protein [Flindersiella endophytica]
MDIAGFAGRQLEVDRLDALLGSPRRQPAAVVIATISGTAGVGKSALAVHHAHRVRHHFPDGQLYVNLRGFAPSQAAMAAEVAVRAFLGAMHVPPERVPVDLDAQAAMYRSMLAGKRVLVVLDNARDSEHVRPLLPGTPGCLVIVTSRDSLAELVSREGATPLTLDLLSDIESRELLTYRLGEVRISREPEAVQFIVSACARLPLALAMVASRAAAHPHFSLAALAEDLRDSRARLDALAGENPDLRAVLSWSYVRLSARAARLFRLLGLHPGPDVSVVAAASLAGLAAEAVRSPLAELSRARLITEYKPGRYGCHDLLRAYALELANTTDSYADRQAATNRMFDHYLHSAYFAERLLRPTRDPIELTSPQPDASPERPADAGQVMEWFAVEHLILLAVLELAVASGFDRHGWQLAWSLDTFLKRRGHWHDRVQVGQAALAATRRLGDRPAQAWAHRLLGRAYTEVGELVSARAELMSALDLYGGLEDHAGPAHVHSLIAQVAEQQCHYSEALDHARQALALFEHSNHLVGQARAHNDVGWYSALLGNHRQALVSCRQAVTLHQQLGDRDGEADAWDSLGYAQQHLGGHAEARACFRRALDLFRGLDDRYFEATVLTHIGDNELAAGELMAARAAWSQAEEILDDLGHSDVDLVRAKLAGHAHES